MISRSQSAAAAVTTSAMRSGTSGSMGRQRASQPASRAWVASISEFVSVISPAVVAVPMGRTSSPVGRMVTMGRRRTTRCGRARGRRGGQVRGAQPVPLGEQQFGRAHVLADRPDVLVGRHGRAQFGLLTLIVHVFAHDHRVAAVGHRVAGVHHVVTVRGKQYRGGLAGTDGVGGADRDAVHPGRVERR